MNADRSVLTDAMWTWVDPKMPGKTTDPGVTAADNMQFLKTVLWRIDTGSPWGDSLERFGNWSSVFRRCYLRFTGLFRRTRPRMPNCCTCRESTIRQVVARWQQKQEIDAMCYRTAGESKGIYCLECDWFGDGDKTTVEPALRLLERNGKLRVPYFHYRVATREELEFRLNEWVIGSFSDFPILYLGFHGCPGTIQLAHERVLCLDDLGKMLDGSCNHRIVHFGSCSTLDLDDHDEALVRFRRQTKALAVLGYKTDVDWLPSMALEVLFLGELQGVTFTYQGIKSVDLSLDRLASGLRETLDFRMHYGRI